MSEKNNKPNDFKKRANDFKKRAKEMFNKYITQKKLRDTRQREFIIDAFLSVEKHITAEQLYEIVRKNDKSIGYATVCRTLNLLTECGIANEIKIGRGKTRYEHKYGHEHHDHLVCLSCGKLIEVKDNQIEVLQEQLAKKNDFLPRTHKLEIYGVCKDCK